MTMTGYQWITIDSTTNTQYQKYYSEFSSDPAGTIMQLAWHVQNQW
jgi:hypothetical protein